MSMSAGDCVEFGVISECCGDNVSITGICFSCMDQCETVPVEDEEEFSEFTVADV